MATHGGCFHALLKTCHIGCNQPPSTKPELKPATIDVLVYYTQISIFIVYNNTIDYILGSEGVLVNCFVYIIRIIWRYRPKRSDSVLHCACTIWRHQMETFSALLAICAGNFLVNSPHKGQWRGTLMFSLICARINCWVNNREAGDFRRHRAHYDVIVMTLPTKGIVAFSLKLFFVLSLFTETQFL